MPDTANVMPGTAKLMPGTSKLMPDTANVVALKALAFKSLPKRTMFEKPEKPEFSD